MIIMTNEYSLEGLMAPAAAGFSMDGCLMKYYAYTQRWNRFDLNKCEFLTASALVHSVARGKSYAVAANDKETLW